MTEDKRFKFSDDIKQVLAEKFPDKDMYNMSLEELETFKEEVLELRQQYSLLETGAKLCGNAAYGASANKNFYFYNVNLAADITGECRLLTKTMWHNIEEFFHETIWERKDLWEKFDFELDESKHDWYRTQVVSCYSDTDSITGNSLLLTKENNKNISKKISIEDLFNQSLAKFGLNTLTENGQEIVKCDKLVLNWTKDKQLNYCPIKWVMRHKVNKECFRIKTKSGKEIIVTEDHSCVVFRNNEQITIKAKDINKDTDKILSIENE